MDKIETFRQFISPFITGTNADALVATLADQAQKLEDLSIAVTDQLTISTASGEYLEQRLSEVGIVQPYDLGMSDDALRSMGIQITANKQIPEVIHTILDTFYGPEAVRAHIESGYSEPFILQEGMELFLAFEDGEQLTVVFHASDFSNINQASAQEIADVITRSVRAQGRSAFSTSYTDYTTNEKYVRIYGSARGPYSLVQILGGEVQNVLEFPTIRGTDLGPGQNNTVWEITRNVGDTVRFRWSGGGNPPALDKISIGDMVMIYGDGFLNPGVTDIDLRGTFEITNVRLPNSTGSAYNAGWFEIENPNSGLRNSTADQVPPLNSPPVYYTYTVAQTYFDDLKFFAAKKNTAYSQVRYALAFEPASKLLKVYLPATTNIIYRDLIGASHLHLKYRSTTFNGSFGSATLDSAKVEVLGTRTVKYKQMEFDDSGSGGILSWSGNDIPIDYVFRENGYTTVITSAPHGITGDIEWSALTPYVVDDLVWYAGLQWKALQNNSASPPTPTNVNWLSMGPALNLTSTVISIDVDVVSEDDQAHPFLGPYLWDLTSKYTLTGEVSTSREKIYAGETRNSILVDGQFTSTSGILLLDLGYDQQEGPINYLGVQTQNQPVSAAISTFSQNGNSITVHTITPHGAIPGARVQITGTTQPIPPFLTIDGIYTVNTVPSANIYTVTSLVSQIYAGTTGISTIVAEDVISTVLLDASYIFKNTHEIGASFTVLSSAEPYSPNIDGSDYPYYVTGTANGTIFAEQLIRDITALGINLQIILIYPADSGLGNEGGSSSTSQSPTSDKVWIWGTI